jgi:predicted dehydrogenase
LLKLCDEAEYNQGWIEVLGVSDDHQELRDYLKTSLPGVPVSDNYARMLDEKKLEVVRSLVENDRHLEVTKDGAARKIHGMVEKLMAATDDEAKQVGRNARRRVENWASRR